MVFPIRSHLVIAHAERRAQPFGNGRQILTQGHVCPQAECMAFRIAPSLHQRYRVGSTAPGGVTSPQSVFRADRESGGRSGIQLAYQVVAAQSRTAELVQGSHDVHLQFGSRSNVNVQVASQVGFRILFLCRKSFRRIGVGIETASVLQVKHREVAQLGRTAAESQRSDIRLAPVTVNLVPPVDIRVVVRILSALEGIQFVLRIACRKPVVCPCLVHGHRIGIGIGHFRDTVLISESMIIRESDVAGFVFASLGHNVEHTVDTLVAIEGDGSGITQHRNRFNFFGRQVAQHIVGVVTLQSVNHYKDSVVSVQRLLSADEH